MNSARLAAIIAVTMLLSATALMQFATGNNTIDGLATHILAALIASWFGVTIVASVISGYQAPTPAIDEQPSQTSED